MATPSSMYLAENTLVRIKSFEKHLTDLGQDHTRIGAILLLSRAVLAVAAAINELREDQADKGTG